MTAVARAKSTKNSVRAKVSPEEWQRRVDLAALYRFIAYKGWDDHIFTHMTARVPGEADRFLVNPLGLGFDEITASSLLKIDETGEKVLESEYPAQRAAFIIHSAVYRALPDAQCSIHLHTTCGTAVASQKHGLLPLSQHAILAGEPAYHDYEGLALDDEECERLGRDFGDKQIMVLRNHGTLTWGRSIPDTFHRAYNLERACEIQVATLLGAEALWPSQASIDLGRKQVKQYEATDSPVLGLAWNAVLRKMDRLDPSYRD